MSSSELFCTSKVLCLKRTPTGGGEGGDAGGKEKEEEEEKKNDQQEYAEDEGKGGRCRYKEMKDCIA